MSGGHDSAGWSLERRKGDARIEGLGIESYRRESERGISLHSTHRK